MTLEKRKALLTLVGRPKRIASKKTRAPAPTLAPAPTNKPARLPKEQQGAGVLDKLERVNDVDYYVKYFTSA